MSSEKIALLGNEAAALGALHAGISAAYGYPGTPSTEAMELIINSNSNSNSNSNRDQTQKNSSGTAPNVKAFWSVNEKTAYEEALGVTLVGKRALVTMKHVGLNVAADPFMSSSLVGIHGGLVLLIADDPGMHSSQNEQDSRILAHFAKIPCLEPSTNQEAYEMTRAAFDLSERLRMPVMLRLVTRLAHSRELVQLHPERAQNTLQKAPDATSWILMPMNAKRQWHMHLEKQRALLDWSETVLYNTEYSQPHAGNLGVITTGIAIHYFNEVKTELNSIPTHLHIGAYPLPEKKLKEFVSRFKNILVIEEGAPFLEESLGGVLTIPGLKIQGKLSGDLPREGELNPDLVRKALGLKMTEGAGPVPSGLAGRPPQLCSGCPHTDSYTSLKMALEGFGTQTLVTSDVGCYTLGALAPHGAIETCVCMGASIGLAKGAADAGFSPSIAVIGDSTFLHSGITPLLDAAAANTPMTLLILDNRAVAMTGGQPSMLPTSRLKEIVLGCGVSPDHVHVLEAHRKFESQNATLIRQEIDHPGLSVIIAVRECIETLKRKKVESK